MLSFRIMDTCHLASNEHRYFFNQMNNRPIVVLHFASKHGFVMWSLIVRKTKREKYRSDNLIVLQTQNRKYEGQKRDT